MIKIREKRRAEIKREDTSAEVKVESKFRFKRFEVSHSRSSMKVGMDSIILGSWIDIPVGSRILDVGTGCGIVALMCAQRSEDSRIRAIDIDKESVEEATGNFSRSPWAERLECVEMDFNNLHNDNIYNKEYDLIISNPPYFQSGVTHPLNPREKARHEDTLSPRTLLSHGVSLLSYHGQIGMIVPAEREKEIIKFGHTVSLSPIRLLRILPRIGKKTKRVCILFARESDDKDKGGILIEEMAIYGEKGDYTEEFITLCKDFYLNF